MLLRKPFLYLLFAFFITGSKVDAQIMADFKADTTSGCDFLGAVNFSDLSSSSVNSWFWDFGNGNNSTLQNPLASYTQPGTYTVKLVVSNGTLTDSIVKTNYITIHSSPTANYSLNKTSGCPTLDVEFRDLSTVGSSAITQWIWDYGDGAPPINVPLDTHTFALSGSYPTSLVVVDANGCKDSKSGSTVTVFQGPTARFNTNNLKQTCVLPHTVNFNNLTTNVDPNTSYRWDFGDGTTSTQASPSKTYNSFGSFNVKLVATNGRCTDSIQFNNFITITDVISDFQLVKDTFCLDETVAVVNRSRGADVYEWSLGGVISTATNPTRAFTESGDFQIRLIASSAGVCQDTTIKDIYIQKVTANFSSDPENICQLPDTVYFTNLSSPNVNRWEWRSQLPLGQVYAHSGRNSSFVQVDKGGFADTLIVTSHAGCKDTLVKPGNRKVELPVVRIMPDTALGGCTPQIFDFYDSTISRNPIVSYQWDFGNGVTSNLKYPPQQSYIVDDIYDITLTVVDQLGCTNSLTRKVPVGKPVNAKIGVKNKEYCVNDSIILSDIGSNRKANEWLWYNWEDTTRNYLGFGRSFLVGSLPDTGDYNIALIASYNRCKTELLDTATFRINGPVASPYISSNNCSNFGFTFFSSAKDADIFNWDFGDGNTSSGVASPQHSYQTVGTYNVKYTIGNSVTGCMLSDSISLPVYPIFKNAVVRDSVGCAPFTLNITSSPGVQVVSNWYINDSLVSTTPNVTTSILKAGTYRVRQELSNSVGCRDTLYKEIKVFKPEAKMSIERLNNCIPYNVAFKDSSCYDTTLASILWRFGDGQFRQRQNATISYHIPDSVFTVSLEITDAAGCKDTLVKEKEIITPNKVVDFYALDSTLCIGDTAFFINTSIGTSQRYKWYFGDGDTSISINPSHVYQTDGMYEVRLIMTDGDACEMEAVKTDFISVQAKPIAQFTADTLNANCFPLSVTFIDETSSPFVVEWLWDFDDGGQSIFQNPFHIYNAPGDFDVSLQVSTSNGCKDTLVQTSFIQTRGPTARIAKSKDTLCKYEEIIFGIVDRNDVASYIWDFGDGNTGTGSPATHKYLTTGTIYPVLILSDSSGDCSVSVVDSLFVEDVIAQFDIDDTIGCAPVTVNLSNKSRRADFWLWDLGDGNTSSMNNLTHTYNQFGTYTISLDIANQNGCVDTVRQQVIVNEVPDASINQDTLICEGDSILLTASGGDNYLWEPSTYLSNPTEAQTIAVPDSSIFYNVYVRTNEGCADTISMNLAVQAKPFPYNVYDTSLFLGEKIRFNVYAGPSFYYRWMSTDNLSCLDCPTPLTQPLESMAYWVEVYDTNGCFVQIDTFSIEVTEAFSIDVPKAFTPNNDGVNDRIYVRGWGLKELLDFRIFNRWGEVVYESSDLEEGWDGTYKGKAQNVETYVYIVRAIGFNGEVLSKKGNLSIIR